MPASARRSANTLEVDLNSVSTKDSIRRRLFLEAVRQGQKDPKFGFQICVECSARGEICVERVVQGRHSTSFEKCPTCKGEKILPVSNI